MNPKSCAPIQFGNFVVRFGDHSQETEEKSEAKSREWSRERSKEREKRPLSEKRVRLNFSGNNFRLVAISVATWQLR